MWHLVVMSTLACSGCGAVKKDATFQTTLMGPMERIEISAASGDIRVRGTDEPELQVQGKVTVRADTQERVDALLKLVQQKPPIKQDGKGWKLGDLEPYGLSRSESVVIDFDVRTPKTAHLEVNAASGDVDVEDIAGELDVDAASGNVSVRGARGNTSVDAASGDLSLEVSASRVKVRAASGDIALKGTPPKGAAWKVNTASGDVRVFIPASSKLEITAKTLSGDVSSELASSPRVHTLSGNVTRVSSTKEATATPTEGSLEISTLSGDVRVSPL